MSPKDSTQGSRERTPQPLMRARRAALAALAAAALASCRTSPARDSGFLDESERMTEQRERYPLDRVWSKPGLVREAYNAVIVSPVNTEFLLENGGWRAANPANLELEESAKELAAFTRNAFVDTIRRDPRRRFRVADAPGPATATLELAIVELVPSNAALAAVGLVAPVARAPVAGVAAKAAGGRPSVAIEGRIRDSQTGETLFQFADREEPAFRVIDVKSVSWYAHARDSIQLWAEQFVELANTPPDQKVTDEPSFRLLPW
jgi:hypothetical protein